MTSSALMLQAITDGLEDDSTAAAALDAIREESGCSLLAAVLEVARVVAAARSSRDVAEARKHVAPGSPVRTALNRSLRAQCPNVPSRATVLVIIVDGDRFPSASREQANDSHQPYPSYLISVGALWVKREASRLMLVQERTAKRSPGRRRR